MYCNKHLNNAQLTLAESYIQYGIVNKSTTFTYTLNDDTLDIFHTFSRSTYPIFNLLSGCIQTINGYYIGIKKYNLGTQYKDLSKRQQQEVFAVIDAAFRPYYDKYDISKISFEDFNIIVDRKFRCYPITGGYCYTFCIIEFIGYSKIYKGKTTTPAFKSPICISNPMEEYIIKSERKIEEVVNKSYSIKYSLKYGFHDFEDDEYIDEYIQEIVKHINCNEELFLTCLYEDLVYYFENKDKFLRYRYLYSPVFFNLFEDKLFAVYLKNSLGHNL